MGVCMQECPAGSCQCLWARVTYVNVTAQYDYLDTSQRSTECTVAGVLSLGAAFVGQTIQVLITQRKHHYRQMYISWSPSKVFDTFILICDGYALGDVTQS